MSTLLRYLAIIGVTVVCAVLTFMACLSWYGHWYQNFSGVDRSVSDGSCNIAVVPIQGDIQTFDDPNAPQYGGTNTPSTSGDGFVRQVRNAEKDPNILGILVPIDSGGGSPVPSVMMMHALKNSSLPTAALIREIGASGAYLAATGANTVIASPFSDVGSIGITYSYLSNVEKDKKDGVTFVQLSSGPFKDTGSPDKPLTDAELALYKRDIKIYKDLFVNTVAENRGMSTSSVDALADGSILPGELALEKGLIDTLGDEATARAWFATKLNMDPADIVLCN